MSRQYEREGPSLEDWVPRTQLGKMVKEGQITSIQDIFREGYKVREVEVIDFLVQDLKDEAGYPAVSERDQDPLSHGNSRNMVFRDGVSKGLWGGDRDSHPDKHPAWSSKKTPLRPTKALGVEGGIG